MTEIRKADPVARRRAVILMLFGAFAGVLLLAASKQYRAPLQHWLASGSGDRVQRVKLVLLLTGGALSLPLLAMAVQFWRWGAGAVRTREYPTPEHRVIRDTEVFRDQSAVMRGRSLQILAGCLAAACIGMWVFLCRLTSLLGGF